MNHTSLNVLMSQIGTQAPAVFVLVVATVLAFVFLGRATLASLLTLAAVAVMLASQIGVAMIQADLIAARDGGSQGLEEVGRQMGLVTFGGAVANAIGLALLVAAIFVRRRRYQVAVS
jgi:hypothetical protein